MDHKHIKNPRAGGSKNWKLGNPKFKPIERKSNFVRKTQSSATSAGRHPIHGKSRCPTIDGSSIRDLNVLDGLGFSVKSSVKNDTTIGHKAYVSGREYPQKIWPLKVWFPMYPPSFLDQLDPEFFPPSLGFPDVESRGSSAG
jgi:hypothetical protein